MKRWLQGFLCDSRCLHLFCFFFFFFFSIKQHSSVCTCSDVDRNQIMVHVEAPHVHIVQARNSPHGVQQLFHRISVNILWSTCMGRRGGGRPTMNSAIIKKKKEEEGGAWFVLHFAHLPSISWKHPWWRGESSQQRARRTGRCRWDRLLYIQAVGQQEWRRSCSETMKCSVSRFSAFICFINTVACRWQDVKDLCNLLAVSFAEVDLWNLKDQFVKFNATSSFPMLFTWSHVFLITAVTSGWSSTNLGSATVWTGWEA